MSTNPPLPPLPPATEMAQPTVLQRIITALEAKGAPLLCTICGKKAWYVGSFVPLPTSPTPGAHYPANQVYPFVTVICGNCGNTHLVNLFHLGFTADDISAMYLPLPAPTPPSPQKSNV